MGACIPRISMHPQAHLILTPLVLFLTPFGVIAGQWPPRSQPRVTNQVALRNLKIAVLFTSKLHLCGALYSSDKSRLEAAQVLGTICQS